jgi:hypothetical protein
MLIIPQKISANVPFSDNLATFYGRFLISYACSRVLLSLVWSEKKLPFKRRVCSNLFHIWMLLFIPSVREISALRALWSPTRRERALFLDSGGDLYATTSCPFSFWKRLVCL